MGKYGKGLYANVLRDFLSNGYKKNQANSLDGYQRDDSLSGQRAQVYHNKDNNKTIVTHRGTSGFQDVLTDIKLAFYPRNRTVFNMRKIYSNERKINTGEKISQQLVTASERSSQQM